MCRNIKTLYNFDPPATQAEIHAAATQYVRKVSGFVRPSKVNEPAVAAAVKAVAAATADLIQALQTSAPPRSRVLEITRAKARAVKRFGQESGSAG